MHYCTFWDANFCQHLCNHLFLSIFLKFQSSWKPFFCVQSLLNCLNNWLFVSLSQWKIRLGGCNSWLLTWNNCSKLLETPTSISSSLTTTALTWTWERLCRNPYSPGTCLFFTLDLVTLIPRDVYVCLSYNHACGIVQVQVCKAERELWALRRSAGRCRPDKCEYYNVTL